MLAEDLHSANGPNRYASALSRAADEISQWRSVFGHLGTPDEVGNEWHALLDRLNEAEAEGLEQAHLLGISAERELTLMAKLEAAEKERDALHAKIEAERQRCIEVAWDYIFARADVPLADGCAEAIRDALAAEAKP